MVIDMRGRYRDTPLPIDRITVPVSNEVFARQPDAAFFIGKVATPEEIVNPELYRASRRLRYNVYVAEKGLMHPSAKTRVTHRESDGDDRRSVHIAVVKNNGPQKPARLVGNTRLIVKRGENDLLPVEKMFPEAFALGGAAVNGVEASRFIARSENKLEQHMIARALIRSLAVRSAVDYAQPVYAVADRLLMGMFRIDRVHYDALAPAKVLDEYKTPTYNLPNSPIAMDAHEVLSTMMTPETPADMHNMYAGFFDHEGLGFFDQNMVHIPAQSEIIQ